MGERNHETNGRPAPRQPRVLVADDEELVRSLLERFLVQRGYQVVAVGDGAEALRRFRQSSFDLVLSDVKMPGLDGLGLLKAIKDEDKRAPVVLISGYGEVNTVVAALKAGAENFLPKPLHLEHLEKVVAQALSLSSTRPFRPALLENFSQTSEIKAPSEAGLIREIVYQIGLSAISVGFCEGVLANNIKLALVEGITNAMEHGNRWDRSLKVEIKSRLTRNRLEVWIKDQGEGFSLEAIEDPTSPEQLLCERGRGIFLMHNIMDHVQYTPPNNLLHLVKYREPDEPQAG